MTARRSKFNVEKSTERRTWDGIVFDSEMEMKFYRDVILPAYATNDIKKFELQKPYELQPEFLYNDKKERSINYVADFYIECSDGKSIVIDIKGHADSVARLKRKMFHFKYPDVDYRWVAYSKIDGGWIDWDVLQKNRSERKKIRVKKKEEQFLEGDDL